jgi:4-hydroxy-2-oxoglutarate aldolase
MGFPWLRGVFPPIPTPFTSDGALATPVRPFLEHLRDAGIDGVVALGSNGEAVSLSDRERLDWVVALRAAMPAPLRLIVGTGAQSTRATIELTRAAASAGAEAALVITPSFYRRDLTAAAQLAHFETVAEQSPIPIIVYNVPGNTGVDLPAEWFLALPPHPNIVGIKDSSGDLAKLARIHHGLRNELVLLAGVGEQLADAMAAGADGGVPALANLAPAACARIRAAMAVNDVPVARRLQDQVAPVGRALSTRDGIARLKAALQMLGFDHGLPRPPLPPFPEVERPALRAILERAALLPGPIPTAS